MRGRGLLTLAIAALAMAFAAPASADDWARSALGDQYRLGDSLGLRDAPWVGTHNSFNSPAEMGPTLSDMDANQKIDLTDQLDAGVRSIELDLHRFPSVQGGGFAPVVCHAADYNAGCSVEKTLGPVLDEVAGWLRAAQGAGDPAVRRGPPRHRRHLRQRRQADRRQAPRLQAAAGPAARSCRST